MKSSVRFRTLSVILLCALLTAQTSAADTAITLNYHLNDDSTYVDTSQTSRYSASSLYTGVRISITDKTTGESPFTKDITTGSLLYDFNSANSYKSRIISSADSFLSQLGSEYGQEDFKNKLVKMVQRNTNLELRVEPLRKLVGSGEEEMLGVYDFISYCFPGSEFSWNVDEPKALWRKLMNEYGKSPVEFGNWTTQGSLAYNMGGYLGFYYDSNGNEVPYPEWSVLDSSFTIPLVQLLGAIPPVQQPADTPEHKDLAGLHWKSEPQAFGELKQGTYSWNRVTEEWEAMAGVPHTETLYYDAGTSTVSADLLADGPNTYTASLPQPPTPFASHNTTTVSKGSHPHSTAEECTRCHHWSHTTMNCSEGDCHTTYHSTCIDEVHHNGIKVVWQIPDITDYYAMDSWSIAFPESVVQDLNGISDNLSLSCSEDGSVSWDGQVGFQNLMSYPSVSNSYACECSKGCRAYASDVLRDIQDHSDRDHPVAIFRTQKLTIKDRDNNSYHVLYPDDIYFYVSSVSGSPTDCGVTYKVTLTMESFLTGRTATAPDGEISYSSDMNGIHNLEMCNFMPVEESWGVTDHFAICGYNGEFTTPKRRDSTCSHDHLFYAENLPIKDISNGKKSPGMGLVSYGTPKTYGTSAGALLASEIQYGGGDLSLNSIIVHTPISISSFRIQPVYQPYDQRIKSQSQGYEEIYLTPSLPFVVSSDYLFENYLQESQKGIRVPTYKNGGGYNSGRHVDTWVEEKWYSFDFEVVYKNRRYSADEWIQIPVDEKASRFTLPVSEEEVSSAKARCVIIATNSEYKGNPNGAWNEQSHIYNARPESLKAPSTAYRDKSLDIVGRIGNMVITYCDDPNWSAFFRAPTSGWQIPEILPNVDKSVLRYFLGPYHDIYDMKYFGGLDEPLNRVATDGLSAFGTIPQFSRGHECSVLPLAAGKNATSSVLAKEPAKLGYPVWWSVQTLGNYSEGASLKANLTFKLYDPETNTTQDVDLWAKVGSTYKRIYGAPDSTYSWKLTTKLSEEELSIGEEEKYTTRLVVGSKYDQLFNPASVALLGTLNDLTLTDQTKTYIGSTNFMGVSVTPNATTRSGEVYHAKQAQRWHGTFSLPSSTQLSLPNQREFLDCKGKYLLVNLSFQTLGATPWTLSTEDTLALGSNSEGYRSWFQTSDEGIEDLISSDCVIVYDLAKTSSLDVSVKGSF